MIEQSRCAAAAQARGKPERRAFLLSFLGFYLCLRPRSGQFSGADLLRIDLETQPHAELRRAWQPRSGRDRRPHGAGAAETAGDQVAVGQS
jgi:hypothetical protein